MYLKTYEVVLGGKGITKTVRIGKDNPISIQTMWKESLLPLQNDKTAFDKTVKRINALQLLGCDILRFAVPDMESADVLLRLADSVTMPLVADIHFDFRLAMRCLDGNIAKIRINPGNIGAIERTKEVVKKAIDTNTPLRIGINAGSLPHDLAQMVENKKISRASALVQTAHREMEILENLNFKNFIVSMKASTIAETIESNEKFAEKYSVPLHIGVTEAGPLIGGVVKSTLALSNLLQKGIGSTMRISLSSSAENEIICAKEILRELNLRTGGVKIVSCPRCGRDGFDVHGFVERFQNELLSLDKDITVAVMGCVVNGPGEGKHADIGISGAGNSVIIFKKGNIVRKVDASQADIAFREEIESL